MLAIFYAAEKACLVSSLFYFWRIYGLYFEAIVD